jgi:hypothetical protein
MLWRIPRHSGSEVIDYILAAIMLQAVGRLGRLKAGAAPVPNGQRDRGRR